MGIVKLAYFLHASVFVVMSTWTEPTSYHRYGDVTIAGMFPLHQTLVRPDNYSLLIEPMVPTCTDYLFRGFRWMQAFLFAIEEINNSSIILPGLKLGWKVYDSCDSAYQSVSQALDIVNYNFSNTRERVKVLVGPTSSSNSIAVANILGVYDIPQISYGSTTRTLSAKIYNSFLRTIPTDRDQANAMVGLLHFYNWTWVGVIGSDNEYGRQGLATFKQVADGICVEFEEYVSEDLSKSKLTNLVERIRNYNATVFVLFMSGTEIKVLSETLNERNVNGKIWVASEAWATSRSILESGGSVMHGTLGIATRGGAMGGFRTFLEKVSPFAQPQNPFVTEFWEKSFNCDCAEEICPAPAPNNIREDSTPRSSCSGKEHFTDISGNGYLDWTPSELEKSYTTYLAVHAIAHALEDIMNCTEGSGLLKDRKCPDIDNLQPWQLLAYIKQVKFSSPGTDENFGFDANGDPNATYKLVSWFPLRMANGTFSDYVSYQHVGNYSKVRGYMWSIDSGAIFWKDENGTQLTDQVPSSICSPPCNPGFYKVNLASDCCFKCEPCRAGEYTNASNMPVCSKCDEWEMANSERTACIPKPEDYMRWNDAYGITFAACSTIGLILVIFTAVVFIRNRNTAIVKATNFEISLLLFLSLVFCFITPFVFIAKPEDWTCRTRQVSFLLSFTFCIACILVKTLRVLTAFQATMPLNSRKRSRWLGEHLQILVVVLVALVQGIICVAWLLISPPKLERIYDPDRILFICDSGSFPLMMVAVAYLAILAAAAFVLAFRARKLPENFNEAKFITFSMLVFFIVWLSFIPAYLTTRGIMATAVYCIGILASTFGILGCIFFPKLYIILVTPENNTSERVRSATVTHAFRAASKSVIYRINTDKKSTTTSGIGESPCPSPSLRSGMISPSPCATKVQRQSNPTPSPNPKRARSDSDNKNGVSIEINGKMRHRLTTPRELPNEDSNIQSTFDVHLQVNLASSRKLSDVSVNSNGENRRSDDELSQPSKSSYNAYDQGSPSLNKSGYQRVPTNEISYPESNENG